MIAQARKELQALLEEAFTEVTVYPFPPDRLEGPAVIIDTAPSLATGDVFGSYNIGFKITVVSSHAGDTEREINYLDDLISLLLGALRNSDISSGSHFLAQAADGQLYLAYELIAMTNYRKEH